jgi:acylphosphatase
VSGSTRQRRDVRYRGQVQGVGFRFAAARVARRYEVTGFVRNEPDGSVRLAVEGAPEDIEAFLGELGDRMSDYIRDVTVQTLPATGEELDFSIRR